MNDNIVAQQRIVESKEAVAIVQITFLVNHIYHYYIT